MQPDYQQLANQIKEWAAQLGFQQAGITDIHLDSYESRLKTWLAKGYHGKMTYMEKHGTKRSRPAELIPGTASVISVRKDYLPADTKMIQALRDRRMGYISRYALGRDYHKVLKKQLQKLAEKISEAIGMFGYRAFVDSAPVLEKPLAEKAGLGWMGKNTLLLNQRAGSWFFLGEIYTDLPLPHDTPVKNHCGNCHACLSVCPTKAIVAPYRLDARRCISYLTIEYKGHIDEVFRPLIGNRIFGCDDCQLVCPWNRFASFTKEEDFAPRHWLQNQPLVRLFSWTEDMFLKRTEGSAIRRAGYESWLRNIAIALGNAPSTPEIIAALQTRQQDASEIVREHVQWALQRHNNATQTP